MRYNSKAGLEHDGMLMKLNVDLPMNLSRPRPDWKKVDAGILEGRIKALAKLPLDAR